MGSGQGGNMICEGRNIRTQNTLRF